MIGRRNLLGLFFGSPLAAVAAEVAGPSVLGAGLNAPTVSPDPFPEDTRSPLEKAYNRALNSHYRDNENRYGPTDYLPPHIKCKKSWSETYKRSVYRQEERERRALWHHDVSDPATMLRALASVGETL